MRLDTQSKLTSRKSGIEFKELKKIDDNEKLLSEQVLFFNIAY
jgi:hypothetical protein